MTHGTLGPQWIDDEIGKANAMSEAPERIWAFNDGPMVGLFVGQSPGSGPNVSEYVHRLLYDAQAKVVEELLDELDAVPVDFGYYESAAKTMKYIIQKARDEFYGK